MPSDAQLAELVFGKSNYELLHLLEQAVDGITDAWELGGLQAACVQRQHVQLIIDVIGLRLARVEND